MNIEQKAIKELYESFDDNVTLNYAQTKLIAFIKKYIKLAGEEGKAYQGRNKREWYQKGFEEGKKEAGKEFQKWWDDIETEEDIDSAMKRIFGLKDGGK